MNRIARGLLQLLGVLVVVGMAVAACTNDGDTAPGGGGGGSVSATTVATSSSTGLGGSGDALSQCEVDDFICDWPTETCACGECRVRLECAAETCKDDGVCSEGESCLCADCTFLPKCSASCGGGGVMECNANKSCACAECANLPICQNLATTCGYWSPEGCGCIDDGVCDLNSEPCQCGDCIDDPVCVTNCQADGDCSFYEGCGCPECTGDPRCAGVFESCEGGVADGACSPTESCSCPECAAKGRCVVPVCDQSSECNMFNDWCICPGCSTTQACNNVANCTDDGLCSASEGCYCRDCSQAPECAFLAHDCKGGSADGLCAPDEPCGCVDCAEDIRCVECDNDGVCGGLEGCVCPDCEGMPPSPEPASVISWGSHCYPFMMDPIPCVDDGVCRPFSEGCGCADCASSSFCTDNTASCQGGAPDGVCDEGDPCSCPDCWWKGKCIQLEHCGPVDGVCDPGESRLCPDCASLGGSFCFANGVCFDWGGAEGCDCEDCADAPTCGN